MSLKFPKSVKTCHMRGNTKPTWWGAGALCSLLPTALLAVMAISLAEATQPIAVQPPKGKDGPAKPAVDRYGDPLPAGALARLGTVRFRYAATSVAYSPDGKILAAGGADNQIRLFDTSTGKEIRRLAGHQPRTFSPPRNVKSAFDLLVDSVGAGSVTTLAFAPDSKTLASGGWDDMVRLWDVDTGTELRKLLAHQAMVARVTFAPDGKTLATRGGLDGMLRLWDPETGTELHKISKLSKVNPWRFYREAALAFSHDSKTVAASDAKGIVLFDVATGKQIKHLGGYRDCMYLAYSPNGKLLASGGLDEGPKEAYSLRLWDVDQGQELRRCELPKTKKGGTEPPTGIAFSPEGDKLIAAIAEMDTYLFDATTGKQLHKLNHHWAYRVAYDPKGKSVVSVRGAALRLWDPDTGKEKFLQFAGHQTGVAAVAVSPNGKLVASAGENIRLWEATTGKPIRTLPEAAVTVAFAPDGKTLASGGGTGIRLWDIDSGKQIATVNGPRLLRGVVFSPDGKRFAAGDEQAVIRIFDVQTAAPEDGGGFKGLKQVHEIDNQALAESLSLAFSPDGKTLACAGAWNHFAIGKMVLDLQGRLKVKSHEGYYVLLWDVESGQQIGKFAGLKDNIKSVAFAPKGQTLAGSSRDGRLVLWQIKTAKEQLHIMAHPVAKGSGSGPLGHVGGAFAATPAVCFAPDGKTLYSASPDKTIRLWDVATAKEFGHFDAPDGGFSGLALSHDGAILVSASTDSTVLVWNPKAAPNDPNPAGPPKGIIFGD
jgi:WD40 repeat protein